MKVRCIDTKTRPGFMPFWSGDTPVEGQIYTVIGVYKSPYGPGYLLQEIRNNVHGGSYAQNRFRPVTDISVFVKILKTEKIDA